MRYLLLVLLLVPVASALLIEDSGQKGGNPVLYGDMIAYEYNGEIHVYDTVRKEDSFIAKGANPSLFAFTVAFETKETDRDLNGDGDKDDTVIQYATVRDKKVVDTKIVGHHPAMFANTIAFSTKESELGVDFTNDGDQGDDIIREYDLVTGEVTNLKAVGDFPKLNQKALVFLTDEKQVGFDLNSNGNTDDHIVEIFDKNARKVSNTGIAGSDLALAKSDAAVFVANGRIMLLDTRSHKVTPLNEDGAAPSIFDEVIVFERGPALYGFSLDTNTLAKIGINGAQPSLFADKLAFVEDGRIKWARDEDVDGDNISDFVDNCPAKAGIEPDSDGNGVGDACEPKAVIPPPVVQAQNQEVQPGVQAVQNKTASVQTGSRGIAWYWYLVPIVVIPVLCYYGLWRKRKRPRSFGF